MPFLTHFIRSQFAALPYPTKSFAGQTIIVTGANVGLGFEAAKHFARLDAAKVILACRSAERGEKAKRDIESALEKKGVVEVWSLNLSSHESVKEFAKKAETLDRIDALIENAGVASRKFVRAESGDEMVIAVNVVGTMLLCCLMIPVLEKSASRWNTRPILSIVSSEVHHMTKFKEGEKTDIFKELADEKRADMVDRYNVSKIMELYSVRALAPLLTARESPVILNILNPGLCYSELVRELGAFQAAIFAVLRTLLARPTEVGSRTLVHAAEAGPDSHGCYLIDCKNVPDAVSRKVRSAQGLAMQEKVWKQLTAKLEQIEPGVVKQIVG